MAKQCAPSSDAVVLWRNNIVGQDVVDPRTLSPHAHNWRFHPPLQREAMAGVLRELGWIQQLVVNRRTGTLVDGHLRLLLALEAGEPTVPVLYVDLDEAHERLALVTLDPLAALAETQKDRLTTLLHEVQSNEHAVQQLLSAFAQREGLIPPEAHLPAAGDADMVSMPDAYQILILCDSEAQQRAVLARLTAEGLSCKALIL